MTSSTPVQVETHGPVFTVVLSRPDKRNAVDQATAVALVDAFRRFEADDDAKVAVLWGEGGHFCAGADLEAIAEGRGNRVEAEGDGPMGPTRMRLSKPVIAAVHGWCIGAGFWYALACDITIVSESAVFAQTEVRGVSNTTALFAALAGWKAAKCSGLESMLTTFSRPGRR